MPVPQHLGVAVEDFLLKLAPSGDVAEDLDPPRDLPARREHGSGVAMKDRVLAEPALDDLVKALQEVSNSNSCSR